MSPLQFFSQQMYSVYNLLTERSTKLYRDCIGVHGVRTGSQKIFLVLEADHILCLYFDCYFRQADVCLVLGSSLQIVPAGNLPRHTQKHSGLLVVITDDANNQIAGRGVRSRYLISQSFKSMII